MNELDFPLDVKGITDDGEIEGLAVGYGNMDHGGDVVLPGAITASLAGRKSLPMLLYHDQKRPIGVWHSWRETPQGLLVKGRFSKTTAGREAQEDARAEALSGLSMGFKTIKQRFEGKARQLIELALHEISLVTIPMNDRTRITSVKDITGDGRLPSLPEFETFLREAGGFSKTQATAIAGKGLSHLLRGEPGDAPADGDFFAALAAQFRA
jgi:HK97 family phage prohead protease